MTAGSVIFTGLLAMAPNWAIVDIPYPEAGGGTEVRAVSPETQVAEALTAYAKGRALKLRKADITELRIDGPKASARLTFPARTETVHLELVKDEWRVTKTE